MTQDLCIIIFRGQRLQREDEEKETRPFLIFTKSTHTMGPAATAAAAAAAAASQGHNKRAMGATDLHTRTQKGKKKSPEQLLFFSSEKSFAGERGQRSTQSEGALENQSGSNCL